MFIRIIFFAYSAILLGACSTLPESTPSLYWPKPPAQPRLIYESSLRSQGSLNPVRTEDRLREFATGTSLNKDRVLLKPYDVAAHGGLVAVSDSLLSFVHIFDVRRKKLFQIGWRGEGKLQKPLGLAMDASQDIYVTDAILGYVVKFDSRGHYLGKFGQKKDFSRIIDVAVDDNTGRVYVLDRGGLDSNQHRIIVYSASGDKLKIIGKRGHDDGEFNHPNQLAVSKSGDLYVLDAGNFRVQVFDPQGQHLRSWGRLGVQLGNLARPRGLAVDDQTHVYITDAAYQNFQIFNSQGQLLLNVGAGGAEDLPGLYTLPAGIATDETGRIYIIDQVKRKIEIFRLLTPSS